MTTEVKCRYNQRAHPLNNECEDITHVDYLATKLLKIRQRIALAWVKVLARRNGIDLASVGLAPQDKKAEK